MRILCGIQRAVQTISGVYSNVRVRAVLMYPAHWGFLTIARSLTLASIRRRRQHAVTQWTGVGPVSLRSVEHGFVQQRPHVDRQDGDAVGGRRRRAGVPAERQRPHGRHPALVVRRRARRRRRRVVRPRARLHRTRRRQHPGRRLRARLEQRRQLGQDVPRTGEEGHAGPQRTIRQLHREGCNLSRLVK